MTDSGTGQTESPPSEQSHKDAILYEQDDQAGAEETSEVRKAHPLSRFFFLKTTFGILLALVLTLGGVMAYSSLVKESTPDLDIPQATISTAWPGADPQTMEEQVTGELEDELTTLRGLKAINSASFDSFSLISVEFDAGVDSSDAMQRLRAKVADAEAALPSEAERPTIQQVSLDDRPVLTLSLFGETDSGTLGALAEDIQERLEAIPGVNEVNLAGARDEVVQVSLQPERLLALNLSPAVVRNAINQANLEQPFGEIESEEIGAVVRLAGQFRDVSDLEALPVARFGNGASGRPIRLDEVAVVYRTLEKEDSRALYSYEGEKFRPSIDISIKKTPGADTVKLIEAVESSLERFQRAPAWPQVVEYKIVQNQADQIWDSLISVFTNGLQAMLAVFLILFIVLSWREGLVAGLSIPTTFAGALIFIWLLGYSLNELVIIGMVISLGLIVDVFILMMEGLHEEIYANKKTFGQAALATLSRYAVPAFAGQLTTILAFAPLMTIGGVSGKFIRVLPTTAIICLLLAFIVALFAAVPLSRYLLGRVAEKNSDAITSKADVYSAKASAWMEKWSKRHVVSDTKRAKMWVFGALGAFALSILAVSTTSLVLYPEVDGKNLGINIELPPTTGLESSQQIADEVGEILRKKPYFESIIKLVGRKSPFAGGSAAAALQPSEAENFIGFSATFFDEDDRDEASYDLADQIRTELQTWLDANVAGAQLLVVAESGGPTSGDPIEIRLTGNEFDTLRSISSDLEAVLAKTEGVVDARNNLGSVKPELALLPNREALDFYGLTQSDLASQIRFALSNDTIGSFATVGPEDDLDIRMGMNWSSRGGEVGGPTRIDEIALIRAFTPSGESVSLASLLLPVQSEAPVSISHTDGERALTVLAKNQGRAVTDIIAEVTPQIEKMKEKWPPGYDFSVGGESDETAETFGSAGIALVVAIIMVFGVLVIVFDSFPQAFILLTTMPLALVGTFLGFFLFGMSFSFFAMIGVIALIGIVVNNGIVMVDTMNRRLAEGFSKAEAAAKGAAERLRPILTTSVTTIIGLIPLAFGNPMYQPLCFVIIFGLVSSTAMSLFVLPALYLLLTRKDGRTVGLD